MRIRRAIGLVIALVALQIIVPTIWQGLEGTAMSFVHVLQSTFDTMAAVVESISQPQ